MSLGGGGTKLVRRVVRQAELPTAILPTYLCPAILTLATDPIIWPPPRRYFHIASTAPAKHDKKLSTSRTLESVPEVNLVSQLPVQCPGCGALSQVVEKDNPGFYTLSRRSLQVHFQGALNFNAARERGIFEQALSKLDVSQGVTDQRRGIIGELSSAFVETSGSQIQSSEPPVCDRCHNLKHHQSGVSICHPTTRSIQNTIFESPHKYNHIYHVIDAADFPMSLVQGLHKLLHLTPQRSLNRRSQTGKFYHGRKTEVSFIITRSDLLAPTKDHVDKLIPYFRTVLRDALGRAAQDVRLGNVRCVSAKRQWWTKELKEEIWQRGGGGWMVGKVNVGKSQLFHEVFPKGRMGDWGKHTTISTAGGSNTEPRPVKDAAGIVVQQLSPMQIEPISTEEAEGGSRTGVAESEASSSHVEEEDPFIKPLDTNSLLPPLPVETSYPAMPLVSSLPGTTASPIRVPFGNGKGELIDLPGLSRSDLEIHVEPQSREALIMTSRVIPTQSVLHPGQSLLLGGFIRITPFTPDLHILAYNFTPLKPHQTSTAKAIGVQTRSIETSTENITIHGTEDKIMSAGKFYLKYDVTKARTGPITRNDAAGIKVDRLPFQVLGIDILIEGVGWVELAAQVRKPRGYLEEEKLNLDVTDGIVLTNPNWPEIEIFTPEGKFIGQRRPMNAWTMLGDGPGTKDIKTRPRKSMKGMKKTAKIQAREARAPNLV